MNIFRQVWNRSGVFFFIATLSSLFTVYLTSMYVNRSRDMVKLYDVCDRLKITSNSVIPTIVPNANKRNCSTLPAILAGVVAVNETTPTMTELVTGLSMKYGGHVQNGGHSTPDYCVPEYKVAIIIPYRDREAHLRVFLRHFHPIMQRQRHEYRIIVVEQGEKQSFNRAMLLNIGFVEALKIAKFDCFVFHDVDHMLENDKNNYGCPKEPKLLGVNVMNTNKRGTRYAKFFGGVTAYSTEQYRKINGHSNTFWGWGGEDDDSYTRVKTVGYNPLRSSVKIGRYLMLSKDHVRAKPNPERFQKLKKSKAVMNADGLSDLKYEVKNITEYPLHTQIVVILPEQPTQTSSNDEKSVKNMTQPK